MKSLRQMFHFVLPYITKYRKSLTVYVFVGILFYSLCLAQPFIFGLFVDHLVYNLRIGTIVQCCAAFLLSAILQIILSYYVKITGTSLQCRVSTHVKAQFFRHFQRTSPRFHMQKSAAAMADKINNDSEYLVIFFLNLGMQLPGKAVCFMLATVYTFYVNFWCGIAVLVMLPLLSLLYQLFKKRIFQAAHTNVEARNQFFMALHEQFNSVRSILLNQLTDVLAQRFYKCGKQLEKSSVDHEKVSFPYSMINENMDVFLKIFLFSYGGYSVLRGRMTVGEFTILYSYMSLITAFFSYFLSVGQETQEHMAFYTRLKELANVPEEGNGSLRIELLQKISAIDLHFGYDDREILHGFTYSFQQDKIYCLAGKNGAGKSTLTNLILGLYVSETGNSVHYNDMPIQDVDLYRMRTEQIGVSEQEPAMLSGSVGFNVTYLEDGHYDIELLRELFQAVSFSNGEANYNNLEELLALDATTLSGGQKQKVSIIKALYKNPQLLLLDEPTSALDTESRHRFAQYLRDHAHGRITILVSHDQELLDMADEVVNIGDETR